MKIILQENGKNIDHFTVKNRIIVGVGSEIKIIQQMWVGCEVKSPIVGDYLYIKLPGHDDFEKFNVKVKSK